MFSRCSGAFSLVCVHLRFAVCLVFLGCGWFLWVVFCGSFDVVFVLVLVGVTVFASGVGGILLGSNLWFAACFRGACVV